MQFSLFKTLKDVTYVMAEIISVILGSILCHFVWLVIVSNSPTDSPAPNSHQNWHVGHSELQMAFCVSLKGILNAKVNGVQKMM